jgi:serine/threonine-protein kinase SRPK3
VLIACRLEQWVSVKIITADRTNQSRELHSLRALAEHSKGSPGSKHIVQLLDDFFHEGPNGCHQCLVFELLGPTVNIEVDDYYEDGERLDTETLLKISTQLLQAVTFMHEAGYAHGGIVDHSLFAFQSKQTFYA